MSKIKNDNSIAFGKKTFFFYFLGLTNLMFGWAHHTYVIPMQPWIRYIAYGVSMTEWILLIHIIYSWKKSLSKEKIKEFSLAYRFLISADIWVFINLVLALLFSIPAINFFTHGTHITVAHSMGTTIGINTSILLGSIFFIVSKLKLKNQLRVLTIKRSIVFYNITLFLFFLTLLFAGVKRSNWIYFTKNMHFSEMQDSLYGVYITFFAFGVLLVISILVIIIPPLVILIKGVRSKETPEEVKLKRI